MAMTQSGGTLPNGKAMLEHVVTVLKQAKDGPLARDALTSQDNNDTVKPLAIVPA